LVRLWGGNYRLYRSGSSKWDWEQEDKKERNTPNYRAERMVPETGG